jgi:phage FluMu gp28-like protein
MLFDIIPEELILKKNEAELVVYFKNGSILQLKGADDPDSLRGAGPFGIVLDEYATMKREVWNVVEPILRGNAGWCWFIGTPKGKNHLFEFYQRGQLGDKDWWSWRLKASESQVIPLHELQASKQTAIPAIWNQEYECEFLEGEGSVFRGVDQVMNAVPQQEIAGQMYVIGCDLAKVQDYTVMAVYNRATNAQVYQERFQTLEWPFQKAKIAAVAQKYNNALVMLDATGIGDPIADDLTRAGVAVEPYKFTEQSKKDLVEKLSIWIEQKKLRMINMEETKFEFDNYSYEIGPTGKIRYGARLGFHDDIVMSHALAVWALQPKYVEVKEQPKTVIEEMYAKALSGQQGEDDGEAGDYY